MNYTKEQAIELVRQDGHNLKILPEMFRNDREVANTALDENVFSIKYISNELKNDQAFIYDLLHRERDEWAPIIYENVSESLKQDKTFAIRVLERSGSIYKDLPKNLKMDRDVITTILWTDGMELKNVPSKMRNDKELVYIAQQNCINALNYTNTDTRHYFEKKEYLDDDKFIETAIKGDIDNAWRMSDRLKDNEDVAKFVIKEIKELKEFGGLIECPDLNKFTSKRLQNDKYFMLHAITENGLNLKFASKEMKNNLEFVKTAAEQNLEALVYASPRIQKICEGKDPIKALQATILHEQLQKEIKPKGLDFAKELSAECKQAAMEQSNQVAKVKPKMKI